MCSSTAALFSGALLKTHYTECYIWGTMIVVNISGSYNGSTPGSEPVNEGPIPSPEASQKRTKPNQRRIRLGSAAPKRIHEEQIVGCINSCNPKYYM